MATNRTLIIVAIIGAFGALGAALIGTIGFQPSRNSPGVVNVSGRWISQTPFGQYEIEFVQSGPEVTGSYSGISQENRHIQRGLIRGELSLSILDGTWRDSVDGGRIRITFNPDGQRFVAVYSGGDRMERSWTGSRQ